MKKVPEDIAIIILIKWPSHLPHNLNYHMFNQIPYASFCVTLNKTTLTIKYRGIQLINIFWMEYNEKMHSDNYTHPLWSNYSINMKPQEQDTQKLIILCRNWRTFILRIFVVVRYFSLPTSIRDGTQSLPAYQWFAYIMMHRFQL